MRNLLCALGVAVAIVPSSSRAQVLAVHAGASGNLTANAGDGAVDQESASPPTDAGDAGEAGVAADAAIEPSSPVAAPAEPTSDSLEVGYRLGRGLQIDGAGGDFRLNVRGRVQILGELGLPRDEATGALADPALDLMFRRARVCLTGNAFGPDVRYKLELAISHRDMGVGADGVARYSPFLDYYVELRHLRDMNVRVGQFKVPFSRERVISSSRLQMVDRSIVNSELNLDRDFGVTLSSEDLFGLGHLRYYAGVYMGEGRDYVPGMGRDNTGFMYIGRVEVLPLGMFEDYSESDHARSAQPRLSLGLGYAFVDRAQGNRGIRGSAPSDGGTTDYHLVTADAVMMVSGFSIHTEAIYRTGTRNPGDEGSVGGEQGPVEAARTGLGWFLQMGYLLPETNLEIAARYGMNVPTGANSSLPARNELGAGLSYYFDDHTYKVQLDAFHLWEGMTRFEGGEDRVRLSVQAFL